MKRTFLTASALALLWTSAGMAQNTTDPAVQPPTGMEPAPPPAGEAPADPGMTAPTPPTGAAPPAAEPMPPPAGTDAPAGEAPGAPTGAPMPPPGEAPAPDASMPAQPGMTPGGTTGGATGMTTSPGQAPADWAKYDNGGKGYLSALEFGSWMLARQGNDMTAEVQRSKTSKRANLPAVKVLNATGSEFMKADKDGNRQISPDELASYTGGQPGL